MGVAKPPSGMVENMPQGQAYQESPGNVPALPANAKPGDWKCACGFHNFARRKECFQCKIAKPSSVADIMLQPYQVQESAQPGDSESGSGKKRKRRRNRGRRRGKKGSQAQAPDDSGGTLLLKMEGIWQQFSTVFSDND